MKAKINIIIYILCIGIMISVHSLDVKAKNINLTVESFKITDTAPKTVKGVVYIPLRSVYEPLGWMVQWNSKLRCITCVKEDDNIKFNVNSKELYENDQYCLMDSPMIIIGSKSYLSRKFITQKLGLKVKWNKKDNLIIVSDEGASSATVNGVNNVVIAGDGIIVNIFEPCSIATINDMVSYSDRLLSLNEPDEAIKKYKEIIENISSEDMPDLYARVANNMGNAYSLLAESKSSNSNILNAIKCYNDAALYYKNNEDTADYEIIQNNLANANRILAENTGDDSHLKMTLAQYDEALKFYTVDRYPIDYALIQFNLGKAYLALGSAKEANNCLINAEAIYLKALESFSIDASPASYALIQYNLGNIYKSLLEITSNQENLSKILKCYSEALKVWTAESYPINYAKVHYSEGEMYFSLYKIVNNPES
ncbi:MAG: copper amine oxidase N-terminal domain-containing protein, partial [Bacillota bacterium]|nr:copper amine oxidase N-terminal domain-containing protein [Bacillota bacterium]